MNLIVPAAQDALIIGGRVLTDVQNLVVLYAFAVGTTSTNATFRKTNTSAGYQVPASKAFKVKAIKVIAAATAASALPNLGILYADNDVGIRTNTAFTNGVYFVSSLYNLPTIPSLTNQTQEHCVDYSVPAQKYLAMTIADTGLVSCNIMIYGYEVAA